MVYGDNVYKQRGIKREPYVAQRILEYFKENGMNITMRHASLNEDMHKKFDYVYTCDNSESFAKHEKMNELKIDIKCGQTLTIVDSLGRDTLEKFESDFIVFEFNKDEQLLWINTGKLRECIKRYVPVLKSSKFDKSKYFFIESYIKTNEKFLKGFIQIT